MNNMGNIKQIDYFKTIDDRLLIQPLEEILKEVTEEYYEQSSVDPRGVVTKTRKVKKPIGVRKAVILVLPVGWNEGATGIKQGDTIVFESKALQDFELIEGTGLIRKYNVLGVWSK